MPRIEIFHERARRRWRDEDKRRLVAETFAPGERVTDVARRHGVNTSQLFTWRKQLRAALGFPAPSPAPSGFAAVQVTSSLRPPLAEGNIPTSPSAPSGVIEIELAPGRRVRIAGAADPAMVAAVLQALVGR